MQYNTKLVQLKSDLTISGIVFLVFIAAVSSVLVIVGYKLARHSNNISVLVKSNYKLEKLVLYLDAMAKYEDDLSDDDVQTGGNSDHDYPLEEAEQFKGPGAKYRLKKENIIREEEEDFERGSPAKDHGTLRKSRVSEKEDFAPGKREFRRRKNKASALNNSLRTDLRLNLKSLHKHTRSYN